MSLPGDGGGPSPASYNPNIQGGMAGGMGQAGNQMWLCGWLPILDFKPGLTPIGEIVPFFQKQCLPGAGTVKLFPVMPEGFLSKILKEIFPGGFELSNWAHDLSPEDVQAIMQARASGIEEGLDASHMKSLLGNMALQNVAINQAAISNDGPSMG